MEQTTRFDFIQADKRIIDQKLRRHEMSHSEHHKLLKSVPDDSNEAEEMTLLPEESITE